MNDLGRALTIAHEGVHAIIMSDTQEEWLYQNHHAPFGTLMQPMILEILTEFVNDNGFQVSSTDLELISWHGLQNTAAFNQRFGIVIGVSSIEYINGINEKIDSIIYNNFTDVKYLIKN